MLSLLPVARSLHSVWLEAQSAGHDTAVALYPWIVVSARLNPGAVVRRTPILLSVAARKLAKFLPKVVGLLPMSSSLDSNGTITPATEETVRDILAAKVSAFERDVLVCRLTDRNHVQYFFLAALTMLLYDHMCTFSEEVSASTI